MRQARWQRRSTRKARVEMIPLIDCMFLLLTFFIYIATTMVLQRGIPVELAHAASGEPLQKELLPIHIFIRSSAAVYLEESPISEADLIRRLRVLTAQRAQRPVVLNAEKGVLHEKVVRILDLARQSGAKQVILAVEPGESYPP